MKFDQRKSHAEFELCMRSEKIWNRFSRSGDGFCEGDNDILKSVAQRNRPWGIQIGHLK